MLENETERIKRSKGSVKNYRLLAPNSMVPKAWPISHCRDLLSQSRSIVNLGKYIASTYLYQALVVLMLEGRVRGGESRTD